MLKVLEIVFLRFMRVEFFKLFNRYFTDKKLYLFGAFELQKLIPVGCFVIVMQTYNLSLIEVLIKI